MSGTNIRGDRRLNKLLATLADEDYKRIRRHLEPVSLRVRQNIYEPGRSIRWLYFPTSCIVSLLYTIEDGQSAEIAMTGNEGAVGVALYLGGQTMPEQAIVQRGGNALRMGLAALREEFGRGGQFHDSLLRFTLALMIQISQTAVCNRLHTVRQRLCRWLLLSLDRAPSDEIVLTQEFIANMLGVRREAVTGAASRLQAAGYISYFRGSINVLDRSGLEATACECYGVVKTEYQRLLG